MQESCILVTHKLEKPCVSTILQFAMSLRMAHSPLSHKQTNAWSAIGRIWTLNHRFSHCWSLDPLIQILFSHFSRSLVSATRWTAACHFSLSTTNPCLELAQAPVHCYPTISSSVVPVPSCLQSFPVSVSFLMSQFFTSGDTEYKTL